MCMACVCACACVCVVRAPLKLRCSGACIEHGARREPSVRVIGQVRCTEIDLMEANRVAWVSTAHVADDGAGSGFGYAHYVFSHDNQLRSAADCAYGPSDDCAINTMHPFHVEFAFSAANQPFSYNVTLSQNGRQAMAGPIRYQGKPQRGDVASAEEANAALRASLDAGMTLVVSHWAGPTKGDMGWLDAGCGAPEVKDWGCTDVFVEHPTWPWLCDGDDQTAASCSEPFTMSSIRLDAPPTPPTPPSPPLAPPPPLRGEALGAFTLLLVGMLLGAVPGALGGYWLGVRRVRMPLQNEDEKAELSSAIIE